MLLGNDRNAYRKIFFDTWKKYQDKLSLEPLEQQLLEIMLQHPEFHEALNHPEENADKEYSPDQDETNPFLHMSLHQAIREQLSVDLPNGIRAVYQDLLMLWKDDLEVEHFMMSCLVEGIWDATQNKKNFDNELYMERLRKGVKEGYWE